MDDEIGKYISVVSLLSMKGLLSMKTSMSAYEDIQRKFKLKWEDMVKIINRIDKNINEKESSVGLDITFKNGDVKYYTK